MTTFKEQSHAVAKCFAICLLQDRMDSVEIIKSMKDAITTLNALALIGEAPIHQAQALRTIALEIIAIVDDNKCIYDDQALEISNKLKKICNP